MMSLKQLCLLWVIVSLTGGLLYAIENPESISYAHTWQCVLLYMCLSVVIGLVVEVAGKLLSDHMVPPVDFRPLPPGAEFDLPSTCKVVFTDNNIPVITPRV